MDWLAWAFVYANGNWTPVVLWSGLALSIIFTLWLRRKSWAEAGLFAALTAFVFFSVMFTAYNGVRSTGAIGSLFLWSYLSIVAFPAAGIVRLAIRATRAWRSEPPE